MSASITSGQQKQLTRFIEDAARKAALLVTARIPLDHLDSKDGIQAVLAQGDVLTNAIVDVTIATMRTLINPPDPRYEHLIDLGEIVVPANYQHATYLAKFRKGNKEKFYYFNDAAIDRNYANASTKLMPGRRLQVDAYCIKTRVTSVDNLAFLASQGSVLTGAQGAALVFEQKRSLLPKERWYVSFDEREALWKDAGGRHRVPYVNASSDGDFSFDLGYFGGDWGAEYVLLVFRDVASGT